MVMGPVRNPAIGLIVGAAKEQFTARELLHLSDLFAGAAGEKMAEEEIEAEDVRRATGEAS